MSKTFDEELEYTIAQGCWDFVNHVTGKDSREKVVNDMAKAIKALIKKHQPEPRDPRRVDAGNESYNDGARGFRMGFTLGAASALADSDKAYGIEA